MNKKLLIISSAVVVAVASSIVAFYALYPYVRNFFIVNGVGIYSTYERLVSRLGEPNNIVQFEGTNNARIEYEGIDFHISGFQDISSQGLVMGMRVTNPDIRFSRHRLGVGSTREEIEQVDWGAWPMRFWGEHLPGTDEIGSAFVVTNGKRSIRRASLWFHFDENDIVVEVYMQADGPY